MAHHRGSVSVLREPRAGFAPAPVAAVVEVSKPEIRAGLDSTSREFSWLLAVQRKGSCRRKRSGTCERAASARLRPSPGTDSLKALARLFVTKKLSPSKRNSTCGPRTLDRCSSTAFQVHLQLRLCALPLADRSVRRPVRAVHHPVLALRSRPQHPSLLRHKALTAPSCALASASVPVHLHSSVPHRTRSLSICRLIKAPGRSCSGRIVARQRRQSAFLPATEEPMCACRQLRTRW